MRQGNKYTKLQQTRIVGQLFRDREQAWLQMQKDAGLKEDELEKEYTKWIEYQDLHRVILFDIINKGVEDLTLARYLRGFLFELVPENFETYVNEHNLLEHWIPEGDREWQELMKLAEQEDRNKSIREAAE